MVRMLRIVVLLLLYNGFFVLASFSQYKITRHRAPKSDEIPISQPGSYDNPGARYILVNNITSERSTIFLGKDVTLDLNGYTIRFADGKYQHISNSGFEEGLTGWELSKAPGAKLMNTADIHVFLGDKLLSLEAGDEIISPYVYLPVANRSYFAMCGITGRHFNDAAMKGNVANDMKVSVFVQDEHGNEVTCVTKYGDTTMTSCPVERKSPRLGGGFIYAHLTNLPAGNYRVRIRADTDCLIDEIDIRPAMDAGISIIEKTVPLASYDHLVRESRPPTFPAFFDYTEDAKTGKPLQGIPQVQGTGTVTIKNGIIESGVTGIHSWGVQSSASEVQVILDNVNIKNSGIGSGAADILWAQITHCRFDVNMPFLVQRHSNLCSVLIRGNKPTEISHSEFYGGQGCLSIRGKKSLVHHNLFVNHQMVTNHYSIMGTGDSSKIYDNRFEPKQGSGIYVSRYTEVFNNVFNIHTSPPTCEYGREEYSVNAVRLGDYGAAPGSPGASIGNRIHHNKINITARNFPHPAEYIPMAYGIYYSASGGENYVYNNDITVNKTEPSSKVITAGLYICGGPKYFGGQFYDNKITTNVPAAWIASMYGGASNSRLYNNTIVPLENASFKTFRIGWAPCKTCVAKDIEFRSNTVSNGPVTFDVTPQQHSYSVYWTYKLTVSDKTGKPAKDQLVSILDKNNIEVAIKKTASDGSIQIELPQYEVDGSERIQHTPYTVKVGDRTKQVDLQSNIVEKIKL